MTYKIDPRCLKRVALAGAAVLSLAATSTLAQPRGLPPGAPPGGPDGPGLGQLLPPSGPELTDAQKLAASLPPPQPGAGGDRGPVPPGVELPSSDPRNIEGTWFHNQPLEFRIQKDMLGRALPYTMEGAKVLERRVVSLHAGKPYSNASAICRPPGQQWQHDLNMPFQIFQSKDWIEIVFMEYHGRWKIVLNPAASPKPATKEYMGYSVGRWDGDTLVVETTDFKQGMWLDVDGTPISRDAKMIHRIRKVDYGERRPYLEVQTTVIDPKYYTHAWSVVRSWGWNPDAALFREYNCEEQVGDPSGGPDAGLIPEPTD